MTRRAALAAAALSTVALAGCGGAVTPTLRAPAPAPPQRLALGITEANPHLLAPGPQPAAFAPWRDRLAALRPSYVRIFVDWAKTDGDLSRADDGCLREIRPCAAYTGLRDQLRAVAARRLRDPGRWRPVLTIYGVPPRFALPPGGCERRDAQPRARPMTADGLAAYRRLLAEILALARAEGTPIAAVSPWNEPNHPAFVSPQRQTCDARAPSAAAAVYAVIARSARTVLATQADPPALVLGELAGFVRPTPRTTAIGEFVDALPDDLACAAAAWAVHDYVRPDGGGRDAVGALERALARRRCTADDPIWVTETGAGGPRPGAARSADPAEPGAGCRALAARLAAWDADPRVTAAFQYSFREDPAYPVGLADAGLTRTWPAYDLWLAWSRATGDGPPPALPAACA